MFDKCTIEDFDDFYMLRCDEENIYWTGHREKPDRDKLYKWYLEQLKRTDRIMFLVKADSLDEPVGYLYLDIVNNNGEIVAETGHGVNSKYKGRGIGTQIIKFAVDYTTNELKHINKIDGWILEDNVGSIRNVLKNGYIETGEKKRVFIDETSGFKNMKRYIYKINRR
ncbi:GNAT family N-acetyltransferase [Sporanaerobacter sp. PP17-6a]|uniref:GNAT family N-acetyltransferase n=1 Tax=Sporanaerobacter sp. PP17-6a TaxID=1891289 RepID=UPI00210090F4|nr:GNAT family protein [Sporanaerobacter sp. PP17-6a]